MQLTSVDRLEKNIEAIFKILHEIEELPSDKKPQIIFFPENTLYLRVREGESIHAFNLQEPVFDRLAQYCKKNNCAIHLTTAMRKTADHSGHDPKQGLEHESKQGPTKSLIADLAAEKISNASVLILPDESKKIIYEKIHLFDIELIGEKPIRESDVFAYGQKPTIFEYAGFRFGSSICFDVRFSELYKFYAVHEVDAILVPAAFLVKTGQAHWETLLRARAIENQCYVLAPAQTGKHVSSSDRQIDREVSRETYGHTMVISPWGEVLELKKSDTGFILCELDKEAIAKVRRQIPMKSHRRL